MHARYALFIHGLMLLVGVDRINDFNSIELIQLSFYELALVNMSIQRQHSAKSHSCAAGKLLIWPSDFDTAPVTFHYSVSFCNESRHRSMQNCELMIIILACCCMLYHACNNSNDNHKNVRQPTTLRTECSLPELLYVTASGQRVAIL